MGTLRLCKLLIGAFVVILLCSCADAGDTKMMNDYLNVCIDSEHHKKTPEPADMLYKCNAWRNLSCCTNYTAEAVEIDGNHLYNFNYSHCEKMSKQCLHRFENNLCFYECSPNIGPWIVQQKNSFRNEKFQNVPLCNSECIAWWDDCKFDKTCVDNWSTGFVWNKILNKRINHCPAHAKCQSFKEIFSNSTYFCEHIWGPFDYKIVDESIAPCMKFTFSGVNNNSKVAEYYAEQAATTNTNSSQPIPPYVPPRDPPLLQIPGTVASFVVAVLLLIAAAGVVVYFAVKRARRRFIHQGAPLQFSRIVATKLKRPTSSHPVGREDYDAEMSFMQYEEEEEEEEPGMDGELRLQL